MSGPVIRISGFIALVPSTSGDKVRVALMSHSGHLPRIRWQCSDSGDPETCPVLPEPLVGNMEMIVENGGALGVVLGLAGHVHDMKSLGGGSGKADASWLRQAPNSKVKGLLDLDSGTFMADLRRCISYTYKHASGDLGAPKLLTDVVELHLSPGARVTLKVGGNEILDRYTEDFWIVNQPTDDLWNNVLKGQKRVEHFADMYDLLDQKSPVRYVPEADCNLGDCVPIPCDVTAREQGGLNSSGPVKCPVALFEELDF